MVFVIAVTRVQYDRRIMAAVDANKFVGIVTLTDIARFQPQMIRMLKQLATKHAAPKSMQKVIDYHIV